MFFWKPKPVVGGSQDFAFGHGPIDLLPYQPGLQETLARKRFFWLTLCNHQCTIYWNKTKTLTYSISARPVPVLCTNPHPKQAWSFAAFWPWWWACSWTLPAICVICGLSNRSIVQQKKLFWIHSNWIPLYNPTLCRLKCACVDPCGSYSARASLLVRFCILPAIPFGPIRALAFLGFLGVVSPTGWSPILPHCEVLPGDGVAEVYIQNVYPKGVSNVYPKGVSNCVHLICFEANKSNQISKGQRCHFRMHALRLASSLTLLPAVKAESVAFSSNGSTTLFGGSVVSAESDGVSRLVSSKATSLSPSRFGSTIGALVGVGVGWTRTTGLA